MPPCWEEEGEGHPQAFLGVELVAEGERLLLVGSLVVGQLAWASTHRDLVGVSETACPCWEDWGLPSE